MNTPVPIPFSGGIDRSVVSHRANVETFYDMLGFRPSPAQSGLVEQVPYLTLQNTLSQGTYYNAGSQTEASNSALCGILQLRAVSSTNAIYVTQYIIRDNSLVQLQVFFQSTSPSSGAPGTETVFQACYMSVISVAGLAVTLGNTLDVEMTATAAFRWRKNGGGWTASVPSTAGVSIDSGNVILYFLANTGFVGNETWTWTRTDASSRQVTSPPGANEVRGTQYGDSIYFIGPENQVMVYQPSGCVVSAGYRPMYGRYLTVYEDHLIVAGYDTRGGTTLSQYPATLAYANSDLNDLNCFVATDVNEADYQVLPVVDDPGTPANRVLGTFVQNQMLFILTGDTLYYSPYLGLPIVFSFKKYNTLTLALTSGQPVVQTRNATYIVSAIGPYIFDATGLRYIGMPVRPLFVNASTAGLTVVSVSALYNSLTQELHWLTGNYIYTLQETSQKYYRRHASVSGTVRCLILFNSPVSIGLGCSSRRLYTEDLTFTVAPVNDDSSGASMGVRTLILQAAATQLLENTKDISSVYISAEVTAVSATYYSTTTNLRVILSWYLSTIGVPESALTNANAIWSSANADGRISFPRVAYKTLNLQITLSGLDGSKPPARITIAELSPTLAGTAKR